MLLHIYLKGWNMKDKELFVDVYGDYSSLYSISDSGVITLKSDGSVVESSYTDCRGLYE